MRRWSTDETGSSGHVRDSSGPDKEETEHEQLICKESERSGC